jgi:predicted amidohydrolase YtcJ
MSDYKTSTYGDKYAEVLRRLGLLLLACAVSCQTATHETADIVIRNARIYTVDVENPWAEAIAMRGEHIVYVGPESGIEAHVSSETTVLDAEGRLVLPGFIDSHNHIWSGSDPNSANLFGAATLVEIQERIRTFAQDRPDLEWIEGEGWIYSALPEGRLPTADDLEGLTGGRPVYLVSYDAHTIWLNHAALERLGISDDSTLGGVELDDRGRPTGVLKSSAGMSDEDWERLSRFLPERTPEDRFKSLTKNLADAARYGITTIVEPQISVESIANYLRARDEGHLKSRLHMALYHPPGTTEAEIDRFEEARDQYDDDTFRVPAVKLYIDDVIEPHTAALLEPYADIPGVRGDTFYTPEAFADVVSGLDRRGFQLFIHAIGDRGIRVALDALEEARRRNGLRDSRHQLVHVELLSAEDIPRFKELGVVACMQPRHCVLEPESMDNSRWAMAVGRERFPLSWAFRSLEEAGATLAFSSDWNVSEMEPLLGIYSAVTRQALNGSPPGGWVPEQRVSVETAVKAYTMGGAYANFVNGNRGSIEVGKYADLVVVSDNLFEIPPERIKDARVLLTLVGGKEVYRDPESEFSWSRHAQKYALDTVK